MRRWIISALCVLSVAALTLSVASCRRTYRVVRSELHPLFLRYEHNPDVAAGFVKGLRIADSVTIDVVTLQAKDTATWFGILEDMELPQASMDEIEEGLKKKKNSLHFYGISKQTAAYTQSDTTRRKDFVVLDPVELSVCLYDMVNDIQENILIEKQFEKITNP